MKKFISFMSIFGLLVSMTPALADTTVTTGLVADTSGGTAPIVLAKWEANTDRYTDASTAAGAQFTASGQYNGHKTIAICAIVGDPDGLADVKNVYADVFYPENIALGSSHVALADQSGLGCGGLMQEDSLAKLGKQAGIDLFCTNVRTRNNLLPTINTDYSYDKICNTDGELWKDTAAVYCTTKTISYEDPSGDYKVWAVAQDTNGKQGILENHFTYLETTAFETDFNSVSYGNVRLNIHKIISGNFTWEPSTSTRPTVRNTGNTRLQMRIMQDDMGLGQTMVGNTNQWNVKFDARVGSVATSASFWPNAWTTLNDSLDLSEMDEMDFSIDISKFPPTHEDANFTGTMTLSANSIAHLACHE